MRLWSRCHGHSSIDLIGSKIYLEVLQVNMYFLERCHDSYTAALEILGSNKSKYLNFESLGLFLDVSSIK